MLIVLVALLAFASVIAVWMRALVLNTDSYVRAVGPLIEKSALRDEIAQRVVDELYAHVDVARLLTESLPRKARVLAPTLAQGIHDTAIQLAASALSTSAVRATFTAAHNRVLAGAGVVVAALLLVVWDRPSPRVVFGVLVALRLWELARRLLARDPARR